MRIFLFLVFLLPTSILLAQDDPTINLMETEDSWRKEAFTFPKPFAPEVDFDGVADVRFTNGWSKVDDPLFWSYAFVWKIDLEERLTDTQLEGYQEVYFDGLMNAVNRDTTVIVPKTNALFISSPNNSEQLDYKGKIRLYDAFFTKEMITLNVNGTYHYCEDIDKHIYLLRLSPQPVGNEVWEHLDKAAVRTDICDQ